MGIKCWMCDFETTIAEDNYGDHPCPSCSVTISVYNPNEPQLVKEVKPTTSQEIWLQQREEKVIPEGKGSQFADFLKLPNPLENKAGEISIGDKVTVTSEFAPPSSPKLKSALIGTVKLASGEERTAGLNWTSYYTIAGVLGKDTKEWIGSLITYKGLKKFEKGTGHLWVVEK